jgi:hypothetical protein
MQDQNLDVNIVIQSFQEKVSQLMMENIVKDATIKQLASKIEEFEMTLVAKKEKQENE